LRGLPVHAVGSATAAAARAAEFTVVAVGSGGVDDLALHGRVLHLAGREHRARAGVDVVPVYTSELIAADTASLAGTVVLVHSPRAGRRLAEVVGRRGDIRVAAISTAAAEAVGTGWGAITVAAAPGDSALIDAAIGLAD
jgi:uroporphyrinogen-III synthase